MVKKYIQDILGAVRWLLIALVTGVVCGLAGVLFHYAVDRAGEAFSSARWLIYLLPAAGAAIAALYRGARLPLSTGTDRVFEATRSKEQIPATVAPLIFVSSFLTHLFGGSSGREGAAMQLGGSLAGIGARFLRMSEDEAHVIELCGMGAVFSALFGTPVGAAFFVIEVVDVGMIHYRALLPCVISSVAAFYLAQKSGVEATRFSLESAAFEMSAISLFKVIALAALSGLAAILFCEGMHAAAKAEKRLMKNEYLRAIAGGAVVVLLTLILGTRDYNGGGMNVIKRALNGEARPEAWVLKLLFTAVTLGAGFKGGEIVPAFFVGATFGCAAAPILGLDPVLGAAIGMIGVFAGVTNTPAASLMLAVELFSGAFLVPMALTVGVSYFVSGRCSLYHSQAILESKFAWRK